MISKIVYEYVKNTCENPGNVLSKYFFEEHISLVVKYGDQLCDLLKADKEILHLSAYLHDISAILDFKTLSTHNSDSAEIAENILFKNNYPKDKIEKVSQCIINHVSPIKLGDGTVEDVCLSNADAMSQITNPGYWLFFAFKIFNLNYDEGRSWYINKINNNWNKLIDPAKKLIELNYRSVKEVFKN